MNQRAAVLRENEKQPIVPEKIKYLFLCHETCTQKELDEVKEALNKVLHLIKKIIIL